MPLRRVGGLRRRCRASSGRARPGKPSRAHTACGGMLEGYAAGLVEKYVAPFADVDMDTLRVAVREGKVTLSDVALKTDAFDALGFPLTLKSGRIGELQVDVAWSSLSAKPARFHMRDVYVVIGPSGTEASAETRCSRLAQVNIKHSVGGITRCAAAASLPNESHRIPQVQEESLAEDLEARLLRLRGAVAASLEEQAFGMRTVAAALGALQVARCLRT